MDGAAKKMTRTISRQLSSGAARLWRQLSLDPHNTPRRGGGGGPGARPTRFAIARQSSLDPTPRGGPDGSSAHQQLAVPENLDATMRLLFAACQGDAGGVEELLRGGVDVDSIDLDGRTALHIAACEGQGEVVRLLLDWKANINARDRWGSTPAADAKHYGHFEVYNLLRARGAKVPKTKKTPMVVSNPKELPEYELNPLELEFRRGEGKSARRPLSLWPGMYHSPVTNALWEARSSIFERMMDAGNGAAAADAGEQRAPTELLVKTPAQSRTSIVYKFADDDILREQYRDPWNEVRIGKLLEDLDALAGTIAVKHCSDEDSTTRPLLVVTASVDKMELKKPIRVDADLKIAGAVTYVGRSSIDIQIEVTQVDQDGDNQSDPIALTANFTFVARDSKTGKSAPVNRLSPETEREKQLFSEREARDKMRKRKREEQNGGLENGIHKLRAEAERLNALLAEGRVFSDLPALADRDSILLKDTRLENSLVCQPQQRNLHGRIFGGFLMHRAFELAFSTAYAFVGQRPCFLEVDHVDFLKPVDVGDFLRFKSCVLYTQLHNPEQPLVNVEVVAHVTRPELRKSEVSNTFHFTFTVCSNMLKNGLTIRNVVPSTEEEARRILERMEAEGLCN